MGNLPSWPGATVVYERAEEICEYLNATEYRAQRLAYKKKRGFQFRPSYEVDLIIEAMNRGDEEALKNATYTYMYIWINKNSDSRDI